VVHDKGGYENANHRIRTCTLNKASEVFFQMAHMHEIGGKAGAARGTSTPTTQAAKVRLALAVHHHRYH
jgi:hypothetical protein